MLHAVTVEKPAAKTGTVPQEGCPPEPDEPKPESIGSIADRWKREREEREERQLQSESSRATAPAKHEGAQRASQHKLEEITHTSNSEPLLRVLVVGPGSGMRGDNRYDSKPRRFDAARGKFTLVCPDMIDDMGVDQLPGCVAIIEAAIAGERDAHRPPQALGSGYQPGVADRYKYSGPPVSYQWIYII